MCLSLHLSTFLSTTHQYERTRLPSESSNTVRHRMRLLATAALVLALTGTGNSAAPRPDRRNVSTRREHDVQTGKVVDTTIVRWLEARSESVGSSAGSSGGGDRSPPGRSLDKKYTLEGLKKKTGPTGKPLGRPRGSPSRPRTEGVSRTNSRPSVQLTMAPNQPTRPTPYSRLPVQQHSNLRPQLQLSRPATQTQHQSPSNRVHQQTGLLPFLGQQHEDSLQALTRHAAMQSAVSPFFYGPVEQSASPLVLGQPQTSPSPRTSPSQSRRARSRSSTPPSPVPVPVPHAPRLPNSYDPPDWDKNPLWGGYSRFP